ncbi:MAG: hypothetical protein PHQ89_01655 [Bacilli bacterium]|nr:hypothetical protein [Bacilli bacterium]
MKKKVICYIVLAILLFTSLYFFIKKDNDKTSYLFSGLNPIATYKGYDIYDIIKQKDLACAEMIEILDSDDTYQYYFNCLRSGSIYFANKDEIIKVKEAYSRGIITKEKLYELGIVDRMEV